MLFQPESPRWLVEKGRYAQAAQTLAYVARVTPEDPAVLVTLDEIKEEFEGRDKLTLWQQFKGMGASRAIAIRCFIPSLVMFFQQWTGTNAINYFSPEIFTGLGITGTSSTLFATGIYGVVKVICVFLMLAFIHPFIPTGHLRWTCPYVCRREFRTKEMPNCRWHRSGPDDALDRRLQCHSPFRWGRTSKLCFACCSVSVRCILLRRMGSCSLGRS